MGLLRWLYWQVLRPVWFWLRYVFSFGRVQKGTISVSEFLAATNTKEASIRPRVRCADGFKLSIQASSLHYSIPRADNADGYSAVEIGFPSAGFLRLLGHYDCWGFKHIKYMSFWENIAQTDKFLFGNQVYAEVPVDKLERVLKWHGGICSLSRKVKGKR